MTTYAGMGAETMVMLELARRASGDTEGSSITTNRIGLLCNTVDITTNKLSAPIPVPFSGMASGESKTIALDFGIASKTVSLSGIIMPQEIRKQKGTGAEVTVKLTAHEIAQLLHSYVDSSFVHEDQNISKLIMLIPSRADNNFEYRKTSNDTGHIDVTKTTPLNDLPLIPFHFANRSYDVTSWSYGHTKKTFDYFKTTTDEIEGLRGFVSTFSTDIAGADTPHIGFSMTFIQSSTLVSDFINTTF